jgi:hypothetical protein
MGAQTYLQRTSKGLPTSPALDKKVRGAAAQSCRSER